MDSSGEYTVEYKFTADVKGLEQGVNQAKNLVKDAASSVGKDFKVNWGEGTGSIKEYTEWYEKAAKETENLTSATSEWSLTSEQQEAIAQRNAAYMEQYNAQVAELSGKTTQAADDTSGFNNVLHEMTGSINDLDTKTKALMASITALEAVFVKEALSTFAKYEDAVYGMAASVRNVEGTITDAMNSIRSVTANGLLSETDAATAIRNLTAYGYSVEEARQMIEAMTVSAEANRKANYTVAEAVVAATQGIKQHSSMMSKAAGNTETLSSAEERYAESLGKTSDELNDAEQRQAIFNSTIEAGNNFLGIADAYENTYSASVQRLSNSIENLKMAFGQALAPLMSWIANAAAWVVQNKQLVIGVGTFVGVLLGSGGVFFALAKIIPAIRSAVAWFTALSSAGKGLVGVLAMVATATAVVATVSAINSLDVGLQDISSSADGASESIDGLTESLGGTGGGGAVGAARDLSAELEKLRRQYLDDLKEIEIRHQDTINKLTKQIQEANIDYKRAVDERNAEFEVQQAKEEKKHQEKVDDIMEQIRFLQRYNNDYNKQKLANLEFALAKENALYQKQTEATKQELELQNENDRVAYEARRAELQAELDDELGFMEKHRGDLQQVRDWIIKDEIEALNERYEEQKKSYEQQAGEASVGGAAVGKNFMDAIQDEINKNKTKIDLSGGELGDAFGNSFFTKASRVVDEFFQGMWNTIKWIIENVTKGIQVVLNTTYNGAKSIWEGAKSALGFAEGGYTGQGAPNEVAGVVHKGEYVLPQEMVDQNTGTPKALGNTYNIYLSGTFATSAAERRKVADQIVQAINQNNKSRLEASWQ